MRICIVGAGAVGGVLGFRLATAGHEVSLVTRGRHLAAIRDNGLAHLGRDGVLRRARDVRATARAAECGPQDLVVLALKAHQIPGIAPELPPLFGAETPVIALQNGIPWWYFHEHGGRLAGTRLESVDPGGVVSANIPGWRVIGSVAWGGYEVPEPGIVRGGDTERDRFPLGEPNGGTDGRLRDISEAFAKAGIRAPIVADIRAEKWLKAWGNAALNPIGALAHATLGEISGFGPSRALALRLMEEVQAVAASLGVHFPMSVEDRLNNSGSLGNVRTSTHQDVEAGRRLEIEGLVGVVAELGRLTGTPTPALDALHACCLLLDHVIEQRQVRIETRPRD